MASLSSDEDMSEGSTGVSATSSTGSVDTFASAGWGGRSWGNNEWGELSDNTVTLTGVSATSSVGTPIAGALQGWGRSEYGEQPWGESNNPVITLTGNSVTSAVGSPTALTEINTGWGSDTWGTETWGQSGNLHQVTGIAMTMAEGSGGISINGDSSLIATGNALTMSTPATVEAFASFVAKPSGLPMTMNQTFDPAFAQPTGIAMSAGLGTAVGDNITIAEITSKIPGYWGYKSSWGTLAWGNGQTELLTMAMSENFSGVDPAPDATVTGQQMSISLAIPGQNSFDITGDANTGAGDTTMAWGDATWGNSRWNNGQFIADPNYGQTMAMSLGAETVDLNTPVDVTGISLTTALNSVADVVTETRVFPSGNALTFSLGTATNVLIWNEVNTGTAPVDPPGWQEVDTNAA